MEHSQDTMTVLPIKLRSSEKERLKRIGSVKKRKVMAWLDSWGKDHEKKAPL